MEWTVSLERRHAEDQVRYQQLRTWPLMLVSVAVRIGALAALGYYLARAGDISMLLVLPMAVLGWASFMVENRWRIRRRARDRTGTATLQVDDDHLSIGGPPATRIPWDALTKPQPYRSIMVMRREGAA